MKQLTAPAYSRILPLCADLKAYMGEGATRTIEGMASTPAIDRQNEIIRPAAFVEGLPEFLANGIMSWNHEWWEPIGRWTQAEVRDTGLWVRGELLPEGDELTDRVWRRVEAGVVRTLSVGYNGRGEAPGHYDDEAGGRYVWDNVSLLEIAVTPLPANPEAQFTLAKSLGLNLELPEHLRAALPEPEVLLPFAPDEHEWDPVAAAKRAGDAPPWVDEIDGAPVAVWAGVVAAMAAAKGLRGERDEAQIKTLSAYYRARGVEVADEVTADERALFEEHEFAANLSWLLGKAESVRNIDRHWRKEGRVLSASNRGKVEAAREALDEVLQADAASREGRALPALAKPKHAATPHLAAPTHAHLPTLTLRR